MRTIEDIKQYRNTDLSLLSSETLEEILEVCDAHLESDHEDPENDDWVEELAFQAEQNL